MKLQPSKPNGIPLRMRKSPKCSLIEFNRFYTSESDIYTQIDHWIREYGCLIATKKGGKKERWKNLYRLANNDLLVVAELEDVRAGTVYSFMPIHEKDVDLDWHFLKGMENG